MALGGPVVVLGRYPTMIDGEPTDFGDGWAAAKFAPDRGVLAEILDAQPHRYRIHGDDATHFQVYLMQGSNTAHYFVFNDDCAAPHCGTLQWSTIPRTARLCRMQRNFAETLRKFLWIWTPDQPLCWQ